MSALLEGALALARRGLKVFPLHTALPLDDGRFVCSCGRLRCDSPAKHPSRLVRGGFHGASLLEDVICQWWQGAPAANVGLVTGDVIVLDVDPRKGGDGSLEDLEGRHGELPQTWRVLTGGGGFHAYFAPPPVRIPCSTDLLAPGLDIKSVGGYVVAPPSLHISGRCYAWSVDHHPDETPLAPMPVWMTHALTAPASAGTAHSPSVWRQLVCDGVAEGSRNATVAKLAGHLFRHYVDPIVALELIQALNTARFRPPLSSEEVVRTVGSIARSERRRREARDGH